MRKCVWNLCSWGLEPSCVPYAEEGSLLQGLSLGNSDGPKLVGGHGAEPTIQERQEGKPRLPPSAHLPAAWRWGVGSTRSHCFLVPPLSQKQWCKITGFFPERDSHVFAARAEGTYRPTEFSLGWQYGRVRCGNSLNSSPFPWPVSEAQCT